MTGNNAWLDQGDVSISLCYRERRRAAAHQASIHPAWLVYALIPAHLSGDSERCGAVAAEFMFLCCFSSPQRVFQTPKNCNFLFKVTQSFSSHSHFLFVYISPLSICLSLSRWAQSRTLLSTHKIRLLMFAFWHLSSAAFQEGDLWETLSPTQHSAKQSWFFSCAVHNSGQLDTERDNFW